MIINKEKYLFFIHLIIHLYFKFIQLLTKRSFYKKTNQEFKNSIFKNECAILNRQINPGRPGILADMLETLNPHEHLLINFEPRLRDMKLQYLTNLFQVNHVVPVFVVNTAKSPLETSS